MSTSLIRDTTLLFPDFFPPEELPGAGGLFENVTMKFIGEEWTEESVTVTGRVELDTALTFDLFGFDVGFGDAGADVTTGTISLTLAPEPVLLAIGVLLLKEDMATVDEIVAMAVERGVEHVGRQDVEDAFTETDDEESPDLGHVRVELSDLTARLGFPQNVFQVGEYLKEDDEVVGLEPHPEDPRPSVGLGEVTVFADTTEGVGIDVDTPDDLTLPPLLLRDTGVGFELREVVASLTDTDTPDPVASMEGYGDEWRGLYVGELTVWGLQSWLPFLPGEVDSENADGTTIQFSEWFIDRRGMAGKVSLDFADDQSDDDDGTIWSLDELSLVFDYDWIPTELSATVDLELAELHEELESVGDDGNVTLAAALRYDPDRPPAQRFGFDVVASNADDGPLLDLTSEELGGARYALYAALAGLAVAGGPASTAVVGALATLEVAGVLETERFAIQNVSFGYDVEERDGEWARVLSAELDLATEFTIDVEEADLNTPLGLNARGVSIEYVLNHAELDDTDPLDVDWNLEDVAIGLEAEASIGNLITISSVDLRRESEEFLIELGIDTEGGGDAAIAPVPDAVILAIDEDAFSENFGDDDVDFWEYIDIRLGGGMPITLLVPGALYARGELETGADALPGVGDADDWVSAMRGSLRGYLIGNGTATRPADYLERSSYVVGLDVGLLSAERYDGMRTVVLTIDGTFNPGIQLGTSGVAIYGLGLVYAQNAKPALPEEGDYAGWYMEEEDANDEAYTTHASKWEPAPDEWGFGASTIIGSAPDDGKSWSAKVGLIILLPGPVIILAGTADTFSEKPSMGGGDQPPFAAVMVLDLEDNVFTLDLKIDLALPEESDTDLVTVEIPAEVYVNLDDPSDFHLYLGRYAPPEARIVVEALGMLDLSAYLMLDGSNLTGLPTVDPLRGLALAFGGEASVEWGLDSSVVSAYWYADAGFHLGVSLADSPLLVGIVEIEGGLVVKVAGFGIDLGVFAEFSGIAPEPFELDGEVGISISLPWPLSDIETSVSVTFGDGGTLPAPPDPFVDCQLRHRRRKEAISIPETDDSEAAELPRVPVDPVFALSFADPINGSGDFESFTVSTADGGEEVWKVVTTEEIEKSGVDRIRDVGYRYELVTCNLRNLDDDETVSDVPATWTAASDGVEDGDGGVSLAAGGQTPRTDLLLFDHVATYLNRTVGLSGEVSKSQTLGWDPCTVEEPEEEKRYDAVGLTAGDDLSEPRRLSRDLSTESLTPPVWARIAEDGSPIARRVLDVETIGGGVVEPPYYPENVPEPIERDRLLAIPQAVARTDTTLAQALEAGIPLADSLHVVLPEHESATVRILVADGVSVSAVGLVDDEAVTGPIELEAEAGPFVLHVAGGAEIPAERFHGKPGSSWRVYACTPETPVDAIRFSAVRPSFLPHVPARFESMAAAVQSVEVAYGADETTTERETLTEITDDLLDALESDERLDVLEPDTEYELEVVVEAKHAERWEGEDVTTAVDGDDIVGGNDPAEEFTHTFTFKTDEEPPDRLRGVGVPERSRDDWDVYARPDGSVPHYADDPAAVLFRTDRTIAEYEAFGKALALRFVDESGTDLYQQADAIAERAPDLTAEQEVWRDLLSELPCLDDDVPDLWLEATADVEVSFEENARYTARIHAIDEDDDIDDVEWADAPAVYEWRFPTSRWSNPGEHLTAHRDAGVIDELSDSLADVADIQAAIDAVESTETTVTTRIPETDQELAATVDDSALESLLFETLGLAPRRPPERPEAIRVWRWDPDTDEAALVALVLDGPEALLRERTGLLVRQDGQELDGRIVTGEARARVLYVPDANDLDPGADLTLSLHVVDDPLDDELPSSEAYTVTIDVPARPPVLVTPGGQP